MKRAVIYARYSSDKQTEQSIEGQLHVCNDFAKKNDYTIVDTYIDRAMTGTNDNRKSFQQMIHDSAQNKFEYVLVYKLDRFARNRYDSAMNKSILSKNGVKVVSATELITNSPEGIIMEGLLESMAEYYSAELSQKVKRGLRESREKGLYTGGFRVYGYDIVDRKFVINETEANIVRRIYKEYIYGMSIKDITKGINEDSILNVLGHPFKSNKISYILHNPKYVGICIINGEEYPNMFPRIIDDFTYEQAQLNNREKFHKPSNNTPSVSFPLSGKLFCIECGAPFSGSGGTSKSGKVHHYYKCSKKQKDTTCCPSITFKKDELESAIINAISSNVFDSNAINNIAINVADSFNKEIVQNLNIIELQKNITETSQKITNLINAVTNGFYNDTVNQTLQDLTIQKENMEKELTIQEALQQKPITPDMVKKHLAKMRSLALSEEAEKCRLIDIFVNKIYVGKNGEIAVVCNGTDEAISIQKFEKKEHLDWVFKSDPFGGAKGT